MVTAILLRPGKTTLPSSGTERKASVESGSVRDLPLERNTFGFLSSPSSTPCSSPF